MSDQARTTSAATPASARLPANGDAASQAADISHITEHSVLAHEVTPRRFRNRVQRHAHAARVRKLVGRADVITCSDEAHIAPNSAAKCLGMVFEGPDETNRFRMSALLQSMHTLNATSHTMMRRNDTMKDRTSRTCTISHSLYEELLAVADHLSASLKQIARARDADNQQSLTKAADDHEAMVMLIEAGAAMSKDMRVNVHLALVSLASLDKIVQSMVGDAMTLCVPVSSCSLSVLANMSTVWHELPNRTASVLSGHGTKSFAKGAAGATRNMVLVYPRVSSGALAEYVKPDDVCLMLRDDAGSLIDARVTIDCVDDVGLQLVYVVDGTCASKLNLSVTVCGITIGPAVTVQSGYDAIHGTRHVATYDVGDERTGGMAVNAAGSMMAVSFVYLNQVHVFRLTPSFERVCEIGREDDNIPVLSYPRRLCFAEDDNILVCDRDNNRVQRFAATGLGEYVSSFGVMLPWSIAACGDLIAVGNADGPIELHSLATGELLRCVGSRDDGPGRIASHATGIRFTPNGALLLVTEFYNRFLSLFSVDGSFVKCIDSGVPADWSDKDISFGAGGEILVTDFSSHRLCVLSPDGSTHINTWGSQGTSAGEFMDPFALAVSGAYLYVLDSSRVQVFE